MKLMDTYKPFLKKVYQVASKEDNDKIDEKTPDIFIPGAGKSYEQTKKKILYVGKDTNCWYDIKETTYRYSKEENKDQILEEIIFRSSSALEKNEHVKSWWENGTSQFWDYIFKLQASINNLNWEESMDVKWLEENEIVTQTFAWGNSRLFQQLNLDKGVTESDFYKKINGLVNTRAKESSECFNNMLKALQPDIIVILNWDEYESFIGKYVEKAEYKNEIVEGDVCKEKSYKIKITHYELASGQHVFWTYHPRGTISRGGVNLWVKAMFKFMKDEKVLDDLEQ